MKTELIPLVVDLDDTIINGDTLHENILLAIKKNPAIVFHFPFQLKNGKAKFKEFVYNHANFDPSSLSYSKEILEYIQDEKTKGREIILATAAYEGIANSVAQYLGCFDKVLSTNATRNLRGKNKLSAIREEVGNDFIYAGDHEVDLEIWEYSKGAIIVGNNSRKLSEILREKNIEIINIFPKSKPTLKVWLKAIRIHQWLKNLLLFVPLLTAFQFYDFVKLFQVLIAFVAFSFGASATYILNDLWDLGNDRQHKRKCKRPFAAGVISIPSAVKVSSILLSIGLVLSYIASPIFLLVFALYLIITTLYSLMLKKQVLVDIMTLSILYTMRIFAGGLVVGIELSYWLTSFSILMFLSLATMKRCAELVSMKQDKKEAIIGRGYVKSDLDILWSIGISSYIGAIILFGLYINEPTTLVHYTNPTILWCAQFVLFYMIGNLWIKTKHGVMHDDPIVFLVRDRKSILLSFLVIIFALLAR